MRYRRALLVWLQRHELAEGFVERMAASNGTRWAGYCFAAMKRVLKIFDSLASQDLKLSYCPRRVQPPFWPLEEKTFQVAKLRTFIETKT